MITDNEKIQKAHEIYYRRNGIKYRSAEVEKKSGFGKIVLVILLAIAIIFCQNPEKILNTNWTKEIKNILNTKIDMKKILNNNQQTQEKEVEDEIQPETIVSEDENIKYEVIWPYNGEITSPFGPRVSENENVTGDHTGIDIAGNYGDDIISATEGTVIEVSEEGNLGKHIKIESQNYVLVYAHCSQIEKQVGDEVSQGEVIAKIGNTGNSTRKSLTF